MHDDKEVKPSSVLVPLEEEGPSEATVFIAVLILGLLAGAISIPAIWIFIIFVVLKSSSDLINRSILYGALLIDTIFCVRLFRWSRLFIVAFALAAIVSFMYCLFISFMPGPPD